MFSKSLLAATVAITFAVGTGASVASAAPVLGSTATVTGYSRAYVFYMNTVGGSALFDYNTRFTDTTVGTGGLMGFFEGDIDIFHNAASSMRAFFYDDGGPDSIADDNDYNDLVVTFQETTQSPVPEPGSLWLLGLAFVGAAFLRRTRKTCV